MENVASLVGSQEHRGHLDAKSGPVENCLCDVPDSGKRAAIVTMP